MAPDLQTVFITMPTMTPFNLSLLTRTPLG
jgi:hypothetical protein